MSLSSRQPLVLRGAIALAGLGAVRLAAWAGWIPADWAAVEQADIERFLDVVIVGITWWSTHRVVTPVADPRDAQGRQLVPAPPAQPWARQQP